MSAQQTNLGIVVGVDGSPCSHTAVEWAARDAQMRNVALRVVQVVPPVITAPEGWAFEYSRFQEAQKREIVEHSYLVAQAHQIVEQAHKVALEASSSGRAAQITGEVLHGQIVPTLANISRQVAMVVLGYRGQGAVAGALLGSVSSSLVRHAHGPVAVIPEEPRPARPPHAPVVVGIDGSPTSGLRPRSPSTRHRAAAWTWWRCTRGATWAPSTFLGSIGRRSNGETSKTSRRKCSPGV